MPKVVFEHWRDDECIERFTWSSVEVGPRGEVCIVFPRGQITLATGDELHFNLNKLVEVLNCAKQ